MNKLILAAAAALALLATPAAAGGYSHGSSYGHSSYGHSSHSYGHRTHSYHQPVHHTYQPRYQAHYVKPVHIEPKVTYVKRPAYVHQKVAGYCLDVVKSYGYNQHRKTVECKAGEYQKPEHKTEQPAPAPEQPAEEAPQK